METVLDDGTAAVSPSVVTTTTAEKRAFRIHPDIIYSVIEKQSGTIGKALLELAMNAADAGSDSINFEISSRGFKAVDKGRGFQGKEEIENWFETFGTPHQEGDATYGRFRMGRGQIMSFAATTWTTGIFRMHVDIKGRGLNYDLVIGLDPVAGCTIEGIWYRPLAPRDVKAAIKELREMVAFTAINVFINGELASKKPEGEQWDKVTDDAYIRFESQGGLRVYNLGVLVRSYPGYMFGRCGVVCSRKPLGVNFARNEILVSECKVWSSIRAVIAESVRDKARKTTRLDADARRNLMDGLVTGAVEPADIENARLIEAMDGRKLCLTDLADKKVVVVNAGDSRGQFIANTRKDVIVISEEFIRECGMPDRETFQDVVRTVVARIDPEKASQVAIEDAAPTLAAVSLAKRALVDECLAPDEVRFLQFLKEINDEVVTAVARRSGYAPARRRIHGGESDSSDGWTDGATYIYINRSFLQRPLDLGSAMAAVLLLVHEYLHDSSDEVCHSGLAHDFEFYRAFHDVVSYNWSDHPSITAWLIDKLSGGPHGQA